MPEFAFDARLNAVIRVRAPDLNTAHTWANAIINTYGLDADCGQGVRITEASLHEMSLFEKDGEEVTECRTCGEPYSPCGGECPDCANRSFGMYDNETVIETIDGHRICCPAYPESCSYVRVVNKDGIEIGYWVEDEWREDPADVMGAILGALKGGKQP